MTADPTDAGIGTRAMRERSLGWTTATSSLSNPSLTGLPPSSLYQNPIGPPCLRSWEQVGTTSPSRPVVERTPASPKPRTDTSPILAHHRFVRCQDYLRRPHRPSFLSPLKGRDGLCQSCWFSISLLKMPIMAWHAENKAFRYREQGPLNVKDSPSHMTRHGGPCYIGRSSGVPSGQLRTYLVRIEPS